MNSLYDAERIKKISQIMPQFSKVARPGDEVYMGLQGDPCFPERFNSERPVATITNVDTSNPKETIVTLSQNGKEEKCSSLTLRPDKVWEYTDKAFRGVLSREQPSIPQAESGMNNTYRGNTSEVDNLRNEVKRLNAQLSETTINQENFQNTLISSLKEMASDIVKLDKTQIADFSRVFSNEYRKMENRAEASFRGTNEPEVETQVGYFSESQASTVISEYDSDLN